MPKRFTATEKWSKEWFQKLSPLNKCFWQYLCDSCDQAGVWEPNYTMASFLIGAEVNDSNLKSFGDRVEKLENGRVWIPSFIPFQCGELSDTCRAHEPIIRLLRKHGLDNRGCIPYANPSHTLQEREEEKEMEALLPEKGVSGEKPKPATPKEVVDAWNSTCLPKVQSLSPDRIRHTRTRLKEEFFLRHFREAIQKISVSNFCLGGGPNAWVATFDWFIRSDSIMRVMEGKYDNRQRHAQNGNGSFGEKSLIDKELDKVFKQYS